jgi:hypothetical protein
MRHIVGRLSPNGRGQEDIALANSARDVGSGLAQAVAGFAWQIRGLQIGSFVHRDTPVKDIKMAGAQGCSADEVSNKPLPAHDLATSLARELRA